MWEEDPHKAAMMKGGGEYVEPEEIADAMYDLVVNEELGDGTIYEVTGNKRRVVPQYHADPPSGYGLKSQGYLEENQLILDTLKTKGLQT